MQKHLLYIPLFALSSALALTACSDEVTNTLTPDVPVGEKTPIELSMGGVDSPNAATRAVITDGEDKTLKPVAPGTYIYMLMKSDYVSLPEGFTNLNFGGAQGSKYSVTRGEVVESSATDKNDVQFSDTRIRYWDDAHARSSKLSIWAIMCPGLDHLGGIGTNLNDNNVKFNTTEGLTNWQTTAINATAIEWNVPHFKNGNFQTEGTLKDRDLCFSNNIANYTPSGTDRRLGFKTPDKKFDGGNLVFYHALSKITVNIKMGEGFTGTNDFRFTETETLKNAQLQYFNIWGKFNVETGEWAEVNNQHQAITGMWNITGTTPNTTDATKPTYQLQALVIPYLGSDTKTTVKGSILDNDKNTKAIVFTIDNNKYEVSRADLLKALQDKVDNGVANNATSVALEAGKHYIFTFTVSKTQIKNLTAQVVGWEEVEANEFDASNARIKLQLEERGTAQTSNVDFWKVDDNIPDEQEINDNYAVYNWQTGYSKMGAKYNKDHWESDPSVYWQNSKNFIHFRALMPTATTVTTETAGDYFSITSSSCENADSYNQIAWGAPMLDDSDNETVGTFKWNYGPTTNGFDGKDDIDFSVADNAGKHQIYKAIGPTEDPVKLILFHMMSGVHFSIKTTSDDAKVQLSKSNGGDPETFTKTRVDLVGYYKYGKVLLGTGLVKTDGAISDIEYPYNIGFASAEDKTDYVDQEYFFSAVPQDLTAVKLYITTPDNNQYIVDLKDVKATTINTANIANPYKLTDGKYVINRWYPGFKYVYSFTLKKTGITDLTATIVEWETVTADNEDVEIK